MSEAVSKEGGAVDKACQSQVVYDLAIADIIVPEDRARSVDKAWVEALAKVIEAQGLINPVTVREVEGKPVLVSGLHRLEAFKVLGRDVIPARLSSATSDDEARLEEVLENLARNELIALDRCHHLYELKQVYERLYPDTRAGVAGGKARQGSATEIFSFAEAAAEQVGLSDRAIRMAVSIWRGLSEKTKARVVGTEIAAKQSDLRLLAGEDAEIQAAALDLYFKEEAASIGDAIILACGGKLEGRPEKLYRAVEGNWLRFGVRQKRAFVRTHREELLELLSEVEA